MMNFDTVMWRIETGMATAADADWLRKNVTLRDWPDMMTVAGWTEQAHGVWQHENGKAIDADMAQRWRDANDTPPPF